MRRVAVLVLSGGVGGLVASNSLKEKLGKQVKVTLSNEKGFQFQPSYAIGDITSVPTPSGFVPYLLKAGVFAHGQGEVVAHNMAVETKGRGKRKDFDGSGCAS